MKALVIDGVAVNVSPAEALAERFHPSIAAQFVDVPDQVSEGWREVDGEWTPPEAPPAPPPAYPVVDVPTFMLLLKAEERVAMRASTDAMVKDFAGLLDDPRTVAVNLALGPVQAALNYMAGLEPPLLAEGRVQQILTAHYPA